jgi:hypothetical protein
MKRTQIQLPGPLYEDVKRVAEMQDWSITEVIRRGAEYMVRCYAPDTKQATGWRPPAPRRLGQFNAPVDKWRELAWES